MKKQWILMMACCLVLLCGCKAEPQWETVDDTVVAVDAPMPEPYDIMFGIPHDAVKDALCEDTGRQRYVQEAGNYEIFSDAIARGDLDSAVRAVSGFGKDEVAMVKTTRFGLPEYQFAWTSNSEEGSFVSRASLVEDSDYYYALVFSVREGNGTSYDQCADAVFSSFGIYGDEGF